MSSRYQEWLNHVFDHEVADKLPQWHYAEDAPMFEASDDEMTELIGQTFLNAGKDLTKYTDEQVDQGIWYFVSTSGANFLYSLKSPEVPLKKRLEAIQNIFHLYSDCFAKRRYFGTSIRGRFTAKFKLLYVLKASDALTVGETQEIQDAVLNVLEKILTVEHRKNS